MSTRSLDACAAILVTMAATVGAGACANVRSELVFDKTIPLPGSRFAGPIMISVPRRDAYGGRDLEYVVEIAARCTPALQVGYPDGEVTTVGVTDHRWQDLLARRAAAGAITDPAVEPAASADDPAGASRVSSPAPVGGTTGVVATGRWHHVTTESWPGQLQFQAERERRCQAAKHWSRRHLTGLDETGQIAVWADTPQELEDGRITVRVYAIGEIAAPLTAVTETRGSAPPQKAVDAKIEVRARPPQPPPRRERPENAQATGAIWRPGSWQWIDGQGEWVWISGNWGRPAVIPPLKGEDRGPLPAPGAQWQSGSWVWVTTNGSWRWLPGEWLAPPPVVENPGAPPVPEQDWIRGHWIRTGATFTWRPGHWSRPRLRVEIAPAPPSPGARWVAGTWIHNRNRDTWFWSPGYYDQVGRAPPPPRAETPSARPVADAVWLAGFWRWDAVRASYAWVAGYWERPPGEGYAWVWDEVHVTASTPTTPSTQGARRTGRWILKVNLDGHLKVRVPGGRR